MFQDRILIECWPCPRVRGREHWAHAGFAEVEGAAPAAQAADLAILAPGHGGQNHLLRGDGLHNQEQLADLVGAVHYK